MLVADVLHARLFLYPVKNLKCSIARSEWTVTFALMDQSVIGILAQCTHNLISIRSLLLVYDLVVYIKFILVQFRTRGLPSLHGDSHQEIEKRIYQWYSVSF